MQKVNKVEPSANTLDEAREKITKLMQKQSGKEYDFDARLQEACEEVRKAEQKAYADNRKQNLLSYIELYCFRRNIGAASNNLPTIE